MTLPTIPCPFPNCSGSLYTEYKAGRYGPNFRLGKCIKCGRVIKL